MEPVKSYNDILKLLENGELQGKDVYTELMQKEKHVLDVSSRIATQEKEQTMFSTMFLNLSIYEIITRFAFTWQNIFTEIFIEKDYWSIPDILFKKDRKIYIGLMMLLISCFLFISYL